MHVCSVHVWLFATLWTIARQASLSVGFSRQEYWSGLPLPSPGNLPYPEIEPVSLCITGGFFTRWTIGEAVTHPIFSAYLLLFHLYSNDSNLYHQRGPALQISKATLNHVIADCSVAQCLTLCDPMNYNLPGSSVHGILQTRILEWVAISFSRGSSQPRDQTRVACIAGRHFTVWVTREALTTL